MQELIYIEHMAGSFEDGLQICLHCGEVLTDYTGHVMSTSTEPLSGLPEGAVYALDNAGGVMWLTVKPEENYGSDDPYLRKVVKCN